jgi:hypothetical protein
MFIILYHATTQIKGEYILRERLFRKDVKRYYSEESGSNGPTTQGFVYFTNEITFSLYFANCHNLSENNSNIYIFKINIPRRFLEADEDEIELQSPKNEHQYANRLEWSLAELKSCRIASDINIDSFPTKIYRCIGININEILPLLRNVGYNYKYVTSNYTPQQKNFIDSIIWEKA